MYSPFFITSVALDYYTAVPAYSHMHFHSSTIIKMTVHSNVPYAHFPLAFSAICLTFFSVSLPVLELRTAEMSALSRSTGSGSLLSYTQQHIVVMLSNEILLLASSFH